MHRSFAFALLVGIGALTSCDRAPRAHVVSVTPHGDATAGDLKNGIRLVFDRPVVAPAEVGRALALAPLQLSPAVEGTSAWVDAQTLVFTPAWRLAGATRYFVSLMPERIAHAQTRVDKWKGEAFTFERLAITSADFVSPGRNWQRPDAVVTLRFSETVRPAEVAKACSFRADGGGKLAAHLPVESAAASAEDVASVSHSVRLQAEAPLASGTGYKLECAAGIQPATGTEGLAQPYATPFRTFGPFKVASAEPNGWDLRPDELRVQITFSNPVPGAQVRKMTTLSEDGRPGIPLELSGDGEERVYTWKSSLKPNTSYDVTIAPGLTDIFGQRLETAFTKSFRTGDAGPRLRMNRGIYVVERGAPKYPLWTRNLKKFDLTCASVPEARVAALLSGPMNYDAWVDVQGDKVDYAKLGLEPKKHRQVISGALKNTWHDDSLDLAALCGGGGLYVVAVDSDELPHEQYERKLTALANVTDIGLLAKVGNASSLIWAVRLSNGEPIAGATVKIRDVGGVLRFTGTTGADGTVTAPGATALAGVKPKAAPKPASGADEAEEDENAAFEDMDDYRARRVIITAKTADDWAVLDTNWNNGIQVWNLGVPEDRAGGTVRVRGFLHSDRGLYRPGDTVHLRGLARVIELQGKMRTPRGKRVHLEVDDPHGIAIVDEDLPVSAFGSFHRDLVVGDEAQLGDYTVKGTLEGQTFADTFSVEEYRPRTFEVSIATPKRHTFVGERFQFTVGGNYLFGSPLRGGKLKWSLRWRSFVPTFPEYPEYGFQDLAALFDQGDYWARSENRSFSEPVADGERALDDKGKARVVATDDERNPKGPRDFLFRAIVTDSSGQAVEASQVVTQHRAALYLGLHPAEFVQAVEMPFGIQAVALTPAGKRRAVSAELTLTRRRYDCGKTDDPLRYGRCELVASPPALKRTVEIPETGTGVERVVLHEPGEYTVTLAAKDEHGKETLTSDLIYVIGKGEAFWSGDEGDRMGLVASRPSYKAGETARLVPQANLPGATALLTIERDGILAHKVTRVATSGEAFEVPIESRHAPNVFASVALVRGRSGVGNKGAPKFKLGTTKLSVDAAERRLTVTVETDAASYRPRGKVTATVLVKSADGKPVKAEIALAAADEGVLQIAGYKTPDPFAAFYAPWGLGVESATTWNRVARAINPDSSDDDAEEGGDAGGEQAGQIRSRFLATAYWNPALVTGADGKARVTFEAPDNLTAFRVMAVAADAGERFGAGERRFTVNKPLQAAPALPRFLAAGDKASAAVIIHNNLREAASVTVTAAFQGVRLTGPAAQTLEVPAQSTRPVAFPIDVSGNESRAVFQFSARGGGESDSVEMAIPILRPTTSETLSVGEGSTRARAQVAVTVPAGALPGKGGLDLVVDPSGLSRLDEGLRYLVGYPYGCLEQTTSKVVPMIALRDLAATLELPDVNRKKLDGFVRAGIAKIIRHQHDDGGFGLWIGSPAEPHYTAFALWGLALAKRAGWRVDDKVLAHAQQSLRQAFQDERRPGAGEPELGFGALGAQAFAVYALGESGGLGEKDVRLLTALFEKRARLPRYGQAFLARALMRAKKPEQARAIIDELAGAVPAGKGPAVLGEAAPEDLSWYWSSDLRTSAIVLSALLEIAPAHPLVGRLADGLLAARADGRWSNTQENLYAMVALADLARARGAAGPVAVKVSLAGRARLDAKLAGNEVRRLHLPLAELTPGALAIESDGHDLFYTARLHVERALDLRPADHGLAVERSFVDADTGQPLTAARIGQLIKIKLAIRATAQQAHVALVDHLPAGLEPVLGRFAENEDPSDEARPWWQWFNTGTRWQHRQLHDDRLETFADVVSAGTSTQEYLARATTVGAFTAAPPTVEAMYKPVVAGRGAGATFTVSR